MGHPAVPPLAGYRVAVTSARRSYELCTLLRRDGAAVDHAAAITMVTLSDDDELRRNTEALIASPPDIVLATTGVGFRGWLAAADGWQLARPLTAALSGARAIARGAKATGALRAAGLSEEWSLKTESSRALVQYLRQSGIAGARIAVQLHAATDDWDPFPEFLDELRSEGADVVPIRVYRWNPVPAGGDFDQLVTQITQRHFDAVSFTSAPAVAATLMRAADLGISHRLLDALRADVRAMCIGPVTAQPLARLGVPSSSPQRMRLAALARHIAEELPVLQSRTLQAAGHRVEIRGSYVVVDGAPQSVSPAAVAILRALAHRPGVVVGRRELLRTLPGSAHDPHAVDTAVLRLRKALGDRNIVATVVKRGYRLAVDDSVDAATSLRPFA
ncbi:uroporphyrinogen-III synthase [Candidatus Mycobacterium methanotrophicum]|uniref:Uroporphyrinogen-III synthase n=1 Tax=Candidatus Mycobacterium methanotrophicum TaxID=2943498 RepID=A0ABY4QIG2_9MYCO|nr:uroporphyrinogen-III synthase [Candidatus Mycobacterium methanotrophicum]UQX10820.1 uroporphyrinogen-III synthase [Candidatus Mycobacterium methanotrophicum]